MSRLLAYLANPTVITATVPGTSVVPLDPSAARLLPRPDGWSEILGNEMAKKMAVDTLVRADMHYRIIP